MPVSLTFAVDVDGITNVANDTANINFRGWFNLIYDITSQYGYKDSGSRTYVQPNNTADDQGTLSVLSYNVKGSESNLIFMTLIEIICLCSIGYKK